MRVLVVGDVMLDTFCETKSIRMSSEAPVMITKEEGITYRLGGAANTAANLKALGIEVDLLGLVGEDIQADIIKILLNEVGIGNKLTTIPSMSTTEKKRILCDGKQVIRIDREEIIKQDKLILEKTHYDAVVISDYLKGAINEDIISKIIYSYFEMPDYFEIKTLLIINGKPENIELYKMADVLIFNVKEAEELKQRIGTEYLSDICKKYSIGKIITTMGEHGVRLQSQTDFIGIPGIKVNLKDVTGAGDTFVSALTYALINCYEIKDALEFANIAAAIKVTKNKTDIVTLQEIEGMK